MKALLAAAAVLALTLLSFYRFPGHTWLQQDSQIYVPILEHLRDPSVLRGDLLTGRPHVSFTIYDEAALWLRNATGWDFRQALELEQLVTRGLGIWGIYLMATAAGLALAPALLVASIYTLGALVAGPMVLTLEYEPVPRALAAPLLICAVGLLSHGRYGWAGVAGAAAFLIHPPTVYPVWALYFLLTLWPDKPAVMRARLWGLAPLIGATLLLAIASRFQAGVGETQVFFSRLTPLQEQLQRMRANYIWISVWWKVLLPHYVLLCAIFGLAYMRIREKLPHPLRVFLVGMAAIGVLSMPLSWALLEGADWALVPQFQPMRALLFTVVAAQFCAAVAAVRAAARRRIFEALLWFAAVYWIPVNVRYDVLPAANRAAVMVGLAALATAALWGERAWRAAGIAVTALAAFWVIPVLGGVKNYPTLDTASVEQLSRWARQATPRDSVFLFPDSGKELYPGMFRSEALRPVYVDWKGGGQVNYLKDLGEEWGRRWQRTMVPGFQPAFLPQYRALGIRYVVLRRDRGARLMAERGRTALFENARFAVYGTD